MWPEEGGSVNELSESLEKSIRYLKERYPADLPLLVGLEKKLESLKTKNNKSSNDASSASRPLG